MFSSLFFLLISLSGPVFSESFVGKVVGVSDGDTITILRDGVGTKVRLYGVDCPEKKQDFGQKAKKFTSEMVFGNNVVVEVRGRDKYGRSIGVVSVDDKFLNEELLRNGLAWWYYHFAKDQMRYKELQDLARKNKVGIWSANHPIPPWEFRKKRVK